MPTFPTLGTTARYRDVTDTFRGYNHVLRTGSGEFYDMKNLTNQFYPMLSCRAPRGTVSSLTAPGGLIAKESLGYVDGGTLYYNGAATAVTGLTAGDKQLVSMGAYICIFPDKVYYNTADPADRGSMEAAYSSTGAVSYALCKLDGTEYQRPAVSSTPPAEPESMQLWIDSSGQESVLKQWNTETETWVEIPTVYTRLGFVSQGELPGLFKEGDGVTIGGAEAEDVNGDKVIYAVGGHSGAPDYIVVSGLLPQALTQTSGSVSISRSVPDMDYVCECQNRLWGCRYGNDGETNINEVYCCALGDFKNWRRYQGVSADSWTASVGSDGPWTGAVNYLGSPMFFKENAIHTVSVSPYGAHKLQETVCRGVQNGSGRSLVVVNETLFYRSRSDVCAFQGGFPVSVSQALGDELYSDAAAGALGDRYYIAMTDSGGRRQLFVYDIAKGMWAKEDQLNARCFARLGDELYCMTDGALLTMRGTEGEQESFVEWMAESGMLYYQYPDKKYVSRFNLRINMQEGAQMDIFIQYDSTGVWERKGRVKLSGTGTVTVPVCPRRCDHMQLRLEGKGRFKLFSIAKVLEMGSDM